MDITPVIHFGYQFKWTLSDELEDDQMRSALALNDILPEPFFVACLRIPIDGLISSTPHYLTIFGITVDESTDLDDLILHRKSLDEFISENPFLEGFHFTDQPRFYCGLPWEMSSSDVSSSSESSDDFDELDESSDGSDGSIEEDISHDEED